MMADCQIAPTTFFSDGSFRAPKSVDTKRGCNCCNGIAFGYYVAFAPHKKSPCSQHGRFQYHFFAKKSVKFFWVI